MLPLSWQQCANSVEELLLGALATLFGLLTRLVGGSLRPLLRVALRCAHAAQWALGLLVPGSFQVAHTVASRVTLLLEQSAGLGVDDAAEPLQRRLAGLPPPVAAALTTALAEVPAGAPDYKLALLKLNGHVRFTPPTGAPSPSSPAPAGAAGAAAGAWHRMHADCYLCPATGATGSAPGYVLSATVQLGPLSWVRGFVSLLHGSGGSQWKLCSPFRTRDVDARGAGLPGSAPLAAFLAVAPCCPTALLPSSWLQWAGLTASTAKATVRDRSTGEAASAVFQFDRAGRIVQAAITHGLAFAAPAASRGTGRMANTGAMGAGSSSPAAGRRGGSPPPALVCWYRQHQRRCGMLVPTELELGWSAQQGQQGQQQHSFLHCDLMELSAWRSLEMAGGHAHVA